jgi:formylmethanofuran dehydrogenase subunit E
MPTMYKVIRAMFGLEAGRSCRRCGEPITTHDAFGMSEGVCAPCRRLAA